MWEKCESRLQWVLVCLGGRRGLCVKSSWHMAKEDCLQKPVPPRWQRERREGA